MASTNLLWFRQVLLATALCLMISCAGLRFSQSAYNDDLTIRTNALALLQKAESNYSNHEAEIETLKDDVRKALENEKKRKGNGTTVAMWNEVINGQGNLFDLLNRWKQNNQLSKTMIEQSSQQIDRLLTSIADLEKNKQQ